jgi:multidrug resistance efflux pump
MEHPKKESIFKKPLVQSLTGILIIILAVVSILLYKSVSSHVSIENSTLSAPVISISVTTSGILDQVYVKAGDIVTAGQPLAHVGTEVLTSKINGLVIETNNTPGQLFSPTQAIIKMIDPNEMRVLGTIKETDGLSKISIGNPVSFTVDAFEGVKYTGVVEEISPTSKDTSVVFSISDRRETKQFTVKAKYDTSLHNFKNGMSAKMKVFYK